MLSIQTRLKFSCPVKGLPFPRKKDVRLILVERGWRQYFEYTVKPVSQTTCIKRQPALRDHCSDTIALLTSTQ